MCRKAFQCVCRPPWPGFPAVAGAFARFARDRRGAVTLDWMVMSAGAAGLAGLVVAAFTYFDLVDGDALAARVGDAAHERVKTVAGVDRLDPGGQRAPGAPVFDPGGRDPGAVSAPAPLPGVGDVPDVGAVQPDAADATQPATGA